MDMSTVERWYRRRVMGDWFDDLLAQVLEQGLALVEPTSRERETQKESGGQQSLLTTDAAGRYVVPSSSEHLDGDGGSRECERAPAEADPSGDTEICLSLIHI